jgi:hypothetical protein
MKPILHEGSVLAHARLAGVLTTLTLLACSNPNVGFTSGDAGDEGDHLDSSMTFPEGGGDASDGCANSCSADYKSVIDCQGIKIQDCAPTQACGAGTCMAPCDAAAINKSSIGCEFYTFFPVSLANAPVCFAMFVANTWSAPITIAADFGGKPLDVSKFAVLPVGTGPSLTYKPLGGNQLNPNEVAILSLYDGGVGTPRGCPSAGADAQGVFTASDVLLDQGPQYGKTFHITTTAPVISYQNDCFGASGNFAASSTLLIPTSGWDTNYVAVTPWPYNALLVNSHPKVELIGSVDGTKVTILPSADIVGGNGVPSAMKNVPQTYPLDKGQILQFDQQDELIGSVIQATQPIAVFGATNPVYVPSNVSAADTEHQQIPPIRSLGSEYAAVRYRDRINDGAHVETVPWRIVGAVKQTTLTWTPSKPSGAPSTLEKGQVVTFSDPGFYTVKSQDNDHPFYLGFHMTGADTFVSVDRPGDPEWQNLIAPAEWLQSYIFFLDPSYNGTSNNSVSGPGTSSLVFIRKKNSNNAFDDVTLDCKGILTGFTNISGTDYQYLYVDMSINGVGVGGCDTGRHVATSNSPFGLQVWGWSTAASYGYPAGMNLKPVNKVVVQPTPN